MPPLIIPCALFAAAFAAEAALAAPIAPKVLVITMFAPETAPWLEGRKLDTRVAVPGLSKEFPDVACDAAGLCVMTTSNTATSGGFGPAITNAYRVASAFADAIISDWPDWSVGVPTD